MLSSIKRCLSISILISIFAWSITSCGDTIVASDDPMMDPPASSDCPPGYEREDGSCWISDPSTYQDIVNETGADPTMEDLLNVDDSILEEQERWFLTQDGRGKYYVYINESKEIGVRVVNNVGLPVEGIQISFEVSEEETSDPQGSTISAMMSISDSYGVARITVTGGDVPTTFNLLMTAEDGTSLRYRIDVIQPNISDNPDVGVLPPGQRCNLVDVAGNYAITSHYELGRFLGDGVFNTLQTINRALTDPGGLIGDWIRDRIGGVVGDVVRGVVRDVVNSLLRSLNLPEWANQVVNALQDVTGLLTDLQIKGNLRLGPATGEDCEVPGVHTWEQLVFTWQGQDCGAFGAGMCGERILNLTEVGVSASESEFTGYIVDQNALAADLEIGDHRLDLNIGVVIIAILENFILPQRSGVSSFGELIARIMPCREFGQLAANIVGFIPFVGGAVAGIAEDACESGVAALGNDLTRQLIGELDVSTFDIKGRCTLRNTNTMPEAEEIVDGRWEGDPNSNNYLQGDFEGERR
jgi:hypothetical protein